MTAATPSSRHTAKCAIVPSGRVKSISTCAPAMPWRSSLVTRTPLSTPRNAAASCPNAGLPGTSSAPLRRQSVGTHDRFDEHVAHAAGRAGHGDGQP